MNTIPTGFWHWVSTLNQHDQAPVYFFTFTAAAITMLLLVAIVSFTVYKVHRNRLMNDLKRDLLDRGMSTEDIVEIVRAMPTKHSRDRYDA